MRPNPLTPFFATIAAFIIGFIAGAPKNPPKQESISAEAAPSQTFEQRVPLTEWMPYVEIHSNAPSDFTVTASYRGGAYSGSFHYTDLEFAKQVVEEHSKSLLWAYWQCAMKDQKKPEPKEAK